MKGNYLIKALSEDFPSRFLFLLLLSVRLSFKIDKFSQIEKGTEENSIACMWLIVLTWRPFNYWYFSDVFLRCVLKGWFFFLSSIIFSILSGAELRTRKKLEGSHRFHQMSIESTQEIYQEKIYIFLFSLNWNQSWRIFQ